jgi:hypothetical protein
VVVIVPQPRQPGDPPPPSSETGVWFVIVFGLAVALIVGGVLMKGH